MNESVLQIIKDISKIYFDSDPMEMDFGGNSDEYDTEAYLTILSLKNSKDSKVFNEKLQAIFSLQFTDITIYSRDVISSVSNEIYDKYHDEIVLLNLDEGTIQRYKKIIESSDQSVSDYYNITGMPK